MGLSSGKVLPDSFYRQTKVVSVAQQLLGCTVHTRFAGKYSVARITETEAYRGWGDAACHAHLNRRTKRTEVMYKAGGVAYVYLCYGLHHLFNIITNEAEKADAVLIRAGEPLEGIPHMLQRRGQERLTPKLCAGPGNFSQALGISKTHYGHSLQGPDIWLEAPLDPFSRAEVVHTTRIGIDYAGEDKHLPWRFYPKGSPFISKK